MDEILECDLDYVKQYIGEYQEYRNVIEQLGKQHDTKFDNSNEQNDLDDLSKLSHIYKKTIILRQN